MPNLITLYPTPILLPREEIGGKEEENSKVSRFAQAIWDPKRNAVAIGVTSDLKSTIKATSSSSPSKKTNNASKKSVPDQSIYLVNHLNFNQSRRSLLARSYEIFSSLQKVVQVCEDEEGPTSGFNNQIQSNSSLPSSARLKYYHRIGNQYVIALTDYLSELEKDEEKNGEEIDLVIQMVEVFSLFVLVHVPSDGRGDGIVSEQILDWVNRSNPQPPKEEGEELSGLKIPYQHVNFWPYIHACIIRGLLTQATSLLKSYTKTHNPTLNQLMTVAISLIKSTPRSTDFQQEIDFSTAIDRFRESVDRLLLTLDSEMNIICELEAQRASKDGSGNCFEEDDLLHFQASFKILLEILRGDQERISEACFEWREALGAHLLWSDPLCKRDDLPIVMKKITKDWPIDETSSSDKITSSILTGSITEVIKYSSRMDKWLICHLIDLIDKLGLKPPSNMLRVSEEDQRSFYIKEFVDYLSVDQGLWRLMIAYLDSLEDCQEWIRSILRRLVVDDEIRTDDLSKANDRRLAGNSMEIDGEREVDDRSGSRGTTRVSMVEVKLVCQEHGLEDELFRIARIISRRLMKERKYGRAIAYCVTVGDSKMISRISDALLDEYLINGPEEFARLADQLPSSLLHPTAPSLRPILFFDSATTRSKTKSRGLNPNLNCSKLIFLSRYRDMHSYYLKGEKKLAADTLIGLLTSEIAPKKWWAVCLIDVIPLLEDDEILISVMDTYELLRCLEEIVGPILVSGRDSYDNLRYLKRIVQSDSHHQPKETNGAAGMSGLVKGLKRITTAGHSKETIQGNDCEEEKSTRAAIDQLNVVRYTLSRHLARCLVSKN
ncbi:Nup85 nucleoporin-domain-containing protein [Phakopsora pachyrhizi]|nr:Nup85 nucleoporin-domain-containing protein [Phakopsora pachyrhizi]